MSIIKGDGGNIRFSTFRQNAQGWQGATHLNIIKGVLAINNQRQNKLYQTLLGSSKIWGFTAELLVQSEIIMQSEITC